MKKRGFTLIELLVVIAIIAILAAILFPVFARAKLAGQRSSCSGNLKQLGYATKMYTEDNNGCFPGTSDDVGEPCGYASWVVWIRPYIKSLSSYSCPGAGYSDSKAITINTQGDTQTIELGYGYNVYIYWSWNRNKFKNPDAPASYYYMHDSAMRAPTQVLLMADCARNAHVHDWNDSEWLPDVDHCPSGMNRVRYADVRRNQTTGDILSYGPRHISPNILFCDFHVAAVPICQF